jgi:hypothetical protein
MFLSLSCGSFLLQLNRLDPLFWFFYAACVRRLFSKLFHELLKSPGNSCSGVGSNCDHTIIIYICHCLFINMFLAPYCLCQMKTTLKKRILMPLLVLLALNVQFLVNECETVAENNSLLEETQQILTI